MEGKFLDRIAETFNPEAPDGQTLDQVMDKVTGAVKAHSEDLREEHFYLKKHWVELRDDPGFHELTFHVFNPEGEYLRFTDGQFFLGQWRYTGNKLMVGKKVNEEDDTYEARVYELAYMDDEFFVMKVLANPNKLVKEKESKYFFLVKEAYGRKYDWYEATQLLFRKHQNNNQFFILVAIIVLLLIALIVLLS
ncbi:MAG TPA: hypothetical protein PKE06_01325 [Flavilitoribacter sp.]|nr:hypothetical protein [Flavilitoribacter sp.]HMQ89100.1 hypothetical protein [Flavilitoribacter sp.]